MSGTAITIQVGSTNVYADLGYADAAEMQRKSQLAGEIARVIKAKRLTQNAVAEFLGIDQDRISRITRGQPNLYHYANCQNSCSNIEQ